MNDLDKELTEIIADLMLRTGKLKAEDNPKIFKQGLQYIKAHDEAKAKIQALISDQVAKAKGCTSCGKRMCDNCERLWQT